MLGANKSLHIMDKCSGIFPLLPGFSETIQEPLGGKAFCDFKEHLTKVTCKKVVLFGSNINCVV